MTGSSEATLSSTLSLVSMESWSFPFRWERQTKKQQRSEWFAISFFFSFPRPSHSAHFLRKTTEVVAWPKQEPLAATGAAAACPKGGECKHGGSGGSCHCSEEQAAIPAGLSRPVPAPEVKGQLSFECCLFLFFFRESRFFQILFSLSHVTQQRRVRRGEVGTT